MGSVLPDINLSKVIGLIELLNDEVEPVETVALADELHLDLDHVIPLLDAAELLGLVQSASGRLSLTQAGKKFVDAGLIERRKLLKESISTTPVVKKVTDLLSSRRSKKMNKKSLLKYFKTDLSDNDAETNVARLIEWGRHAELLGYDSDSDQVYLL